MAVTFNYNTLTVSFFYYCSLSLSCTPFQFTLILKEMALHAWCHAPVHEVKCDLCSCAVYKPTLTTESNHPQGPRTLMNPLRYLALNLTYMSNHIFDKGRVRK